MMTIPDKPFDVEAAAQHLGCSAAHVRRLCADGKIRHFRLGKLIRIPVAALAELGECASSGSEANGTPTGERGDSPDAPRSELRLVRMPNADL